MEMHEIRYFLAACQTLNFHKAAALVHVTQPALTRAIQKLEAELGGNLFHRDAGHVRLTGFGCLMRAELDEILRRSEDAKRAARSFLRLEAPPLTLGVMCTIGPQRFVAFLDAFRQRHPHIRITMVEGVANRITDLVMAGRVDAALLARPQPFDTKLSVEPIYSERFGLAFAEGHRFELRNTLHLSDIRGETYIDRANCEYAGHIEWLCRSRGIEIESAFRSEREDWILAMVAAGMGICFMAEFSAHQAGVCHRPVADPEIVREVSLVSVAGRTHSPVVPLLADALRDHDWDSAPAN